MLHEALRRLGKHSLIYALGPAAQKLIGFLLLPLVTAYVGSTADYGVGEIAAVTLAVAAQLAGINLLHGMTRFHAEYESERERAALVTTTLLVLCASTSVAFLAAWLLRESGARLLFGDSRYAPALVLVGLILVLQTIAQVGLRYLQILQRSAAYGVLTTTKTVLEVASKVWFLVPLGLSYMGLLYSVALGEGLIALVLSVWIVRRLGLSFSGAMARRLWRYSAPLFLSGLLMFVLHQADRWFVLAYGGEGAVGVYALGYKLGAAGNAVVFEAFGLIWFPFVFALRDEGEQRELCRQVATLLMALLAFVALGIALFAREIVALMADAKYAEAWRALPLVAAGYLFWALYQIVHTAFYLRERTALVAWTTAFAALCNLGLNALLVPRLGWMGAAWATLATFALLALCAWRLAERLWPVRYEAGRIAGLLALAAGAWAAGMALLPESGLACWAGKLALLLGFPLLVWHGGFLNRAEREMIKRTLLPRP